MRDVQSPIAIVTDGMWRKSLSAIRSLGKAGYEVHVLGDTWLTVGFWSRFTRRRIVTPDPRDDSEGFGRRLLQHLQALRDEGRGSPLPVLIPMEDASLGFVVANAARIKKLATVVVPSAEALAVFADKARTMALAQSIGVPHPASVEVTTGAALMAAIGALAPNSDFIVKPAFGSGSRGLRYRPSFTLEQAQSYIGQVGSALLQERIPAEGDAIGVSVLFDQDGECVANFTHKRLRQFPNSGGPSTDRVGIEDAALLQLSLRLLEAVHWTGVAMVEWKRHPQTGTPMLMEVNPRFWGSLELATRSGVDFPVLYSRVASGASVPVSVPVPGIRCRWLIPGDILRWLSASSEKREPLRDFVRGLPWLAEEWDPADIRGAMACLVCQALAVLQPKYLRMLKR